MAVDILTTDTELRDLWSTFHGARKDTVRIDKEALRHLLTDHATLYGAATGPAIRFDGRRVGKGHKVNVGADQGSMSGDAAGEVAMTMTFDEWRRTGRYQPEGFDADIHWAGPVYEYEGGFIGIDLLGGLTVPICNQEFHFYTLAEAERCLWEEWVRDEYADIMEVGGDQ